MKRITRKYVLLLAMMLSLFSGKLLAQCGTPPVAYPGTISCQGGTTNVPIDLNLLGGPYKVTPYLDYSFPTLNNPWDYTYNHPGPTYTVTNLSAGPNHKVYIVDLSIGCYDSVMFSLTEPAMLIMSNLFQSPVYCSGTVMADFVIGGGTPPYTISYTQNGISWNNLVTTSNPTYNTNIPLGAYAYKVTDMNGCLFDQSSTVFGSAPTDQSHWYVGMCGVTDSSVQYLTNGNQSFSRSVTLLMQGIGSFTDTLNLEVDFGDGSPLATFGTEVAYTNTPMPVSHTYSTPGVYKVTYTAINVSNPDTAVVVEFINNNSDVYPGDANGDGIANNFDLLNIGIGFGAAGPARPGASLSWTAQPCTDWSQNFTAGLNYKHADCDGNALIDYPDTNAIIVNYGQSHVLKLAQMQGGPGSPDLVIDFPSGNYAPGTPVTVPVTLGSSTVPATDAYGIAFTVNYPVNAFDAANVNVSFNNSWLGTVGTDAVAIRKNHSSSGSIDIAISRNDQVNLTGFGTICELGFITIDNVSGKMTSQGLEYITFSNVRLIDKDGYEIGVNAIRDSITINGPTGITVPEKSSTIKIYPNPAKDHVIISGGENIEEIQVVSIFGQVVIHSLPNTDSARIETMNIESGLYIVKIRTRNGTSTRRIEVIK